MIGTNKINFLTFVAPGGPAEGAGVSGVSGGEAPATPAPALDLHDDSQGKHSDSNTQVPQCRPPSRSHLPVRKRQYDTKINIFIDTTVQSQIHHLLPIMCLV